jgi:hypothetical protein
VQLPREVSGSLITKKGGEIKEVRNFNSVSEDESENRQVFGMEQGLRHQTEGTNVTLYL